MSLTTAALYSDGVYTMSYWRSRCSFMTLRMSVSVSSKKRRCASTASGPTAASGGKCSEKLLGSPSTSSPLMAATTRSCLFMT